MLKKFMVVMASKILRSYCSEHMLCSKCLFFASHKPGKPPCVLGQSIPENWTIKEGGK